MDLFFQCHLSLKKQASTMSVARGGTAGTTLGRDSSGSWASVHFEDNEADMLGKSKWLACASLTAIALASPAMAASPTKGSKAPTNQELLERIEKLEQQQEKSKDTIGKQRERITVLEDKSKEVQWSLDNGRPTIKSGDGRFQMSVRARFHIDVGNYFQDSNLPAAVTARDLAGGSNVRRAQFGIEGKVFKDFNYEIRYEFGGSGTEGSGTINLMRLAYNFTPALRINAGVIQPIFTHSDSVSSNEITFMERADVINLLTGAYGGSDSRRGVEVTYQKKDFLRGGDNLVLSGAFTGDSIGTADGTDEGSQVLGRIAYRIWSSGKSNIQIGASGAKILNVNGGAGGAAKNITLQDRPELRLDATRLVSTGAIPTEGGSAYGFEGGANFRNFYVAGEYYKFGLERDRGCTGCSATAGNPDFDGWYVEGSWIITGEPKNYAASSSGNNAGVFGAPKVIKPFSLAGNSWGAWELAARYSVLDLNWNAGLPGAATPAGGIRGGEEKIWTIGVNWYMNNNVRIMVNYLNIDVNRLNGAGVQIGQELDAVAGRLQFAM